MNGVIYIYITEPISPTSVCVCVCDSTGRGHLSSFFFLFFRLRSEGYFIQLVGLYGTVYMYIYTHTHDTTFAVIAADGGQEGSGGGEKKLPTHAYTYAEDICLTKHTIKGSTRPEYIMISRYDGGDVTVRVIRKYFAVPFYINIRACNARSVINLYGKRRTDCRRPWTMEEVPRDVWGRISSGRRARFRGL